MKDTIQVFIGTKAQYIKTAPLIRLMDERSTSYRLIDSGQHAELSQRLRDELGLRDPDCYLGRKGDVASIPGALRWSSRLALRLSSPGSLRREVFGGMGGICVVHGDTPSTLLAALMARRAGLEVAHIEAGLRSHSYLHPFPEEMIRAIVMRKSDLLFAPDRVAEENLARMGVRGQVIRTPGNTSLEAVFYSLQHDPRPGAGPAVVTIHRVENLHRQGRFESLVALVEGIAQHWPITFVAHEPTLAVLRRHGGEDRLRAVGVAISSLQTHRDFLALLAGAPFVVTDGGSVQEECALLGVPTLLWRARTERHDGIGENILLSHYDNVLIREFLKNPGIYRRDPKPLASRPSQTILDAIVSASSR